MTLINKTEWNLYFYENPLQRDWQDLSQQHKILLRLSRRQENDLASSSSSIWIREMIYPQVLSLLAEHSPICETTSAEQPVDDD